MGQMRGVYPETLGRQKLSISSFTRDFYHGGICHLNLSIMSIGLPLPYWPHLISQMLASTVTVMHNGWLCAERLEGRETDAAVRWLSQVLTPVFVSSVLVRPLGAFSPVPPYSPTAKGDELVTWRPL